MLANTETLFVYSDGQVERDLRPYLGESSAKVVHVSAVWMQSLNK